MNHRACMSRAHHRAPQQLASLLALAAFATACPAPPQAPLEAAPIGSIVGEVFIEDPERVSVGGATVEVYGTAARITSEAGKQFVLGGLPLREHTLIVTDGASGRSARFSASLTQPYQTLYLPAADTTLRRSARLAGRVEVSEGSPAGTSVYLIGGNGRQVTTAGDDGSFFLDLLPAGKVDVAFSRVGYDTAVVSTTLDEGDNDLGDTVALAPTSAGSLRLAGAVALAGATDQRGVSVLLNGGEQVVPTDAEGRYQFENLSPGVYAIRAQAPGYRSVELPLVALTSSGEAPGLVDLFLSVGNDPEETPRAFSVAITSPGSGAVFPLGERIPFVAEVELENGVVPPSQIRWTYADGSPDAAPDAPELPLCDNDGAGTCTGAEVRVDTLPEGTHWVRVSAASVDGEVKSARTLVYVVERTRRFSVNIDAPNTGAVFPTGTEVRFLADIEIDDEVIPASHILWTYEALTAPGDADAGPASEASLPLCDNAGTGVCQGSEVRTRTLPVGEFRVTLRVTAADGALRTDQVEVQVVPVERTFLVSVVSPAAGALFEQTAPISFLADVTLEGETIPPGRLTWTRRDADDESAPVVPLCGEGGAPCAGNPVTASDLPVGRHLVTVKAEAANGDSRVARQVVEVVPLALGVQMVEPAIAARLQASVPVVLSATLQARPGLVVRDEDVVWRAAPCGEAGEVLGTGLNTIASFGPGLIGSPTLSVTADYQGIAQGCAESIVFVDALVRDEVKPGFALFGVKAPIVDDVPDGAGSTLKQYALFAGQPVQLRADVDAAYEVAWGSDTGVAVGGGLLDLAIFPVGLHRVELRVRDTSGVEETSVLLVKIDPVDESVFFVDASAPALNPANPYLAEFGLPLAAAVQHPYQENFLAEAVRWFDAQGRLVATGLSGRTFAVALGAGALRVVVDDTAGHQAVDVATYLLRASEFSVDFSAPAEGATFEAGDALPVALEVSHSEFDLDDPQSPITRADFRVTLVQEFVPVSGNDVTAVLAADVALTDLAVTLADLPAGTHTLSAHVFFGTQVREVRRTFVVYPPQPLRAFITQPQTRPLQLVHGAGVTFALSLFDPYPESGALEVSWTLDGGEFDPAWGGYGSDATAQARRSLALPNYDATAAPWNDPRWAPGAHEVEVCVTRAGDPQKLACDRVGVVSPSRYTVQDTVTLSGSQSLELSGVVLLTGSITVRDTATLLIRPGTRIIPHTSSAGLYVDSGYVYIGEAEGPPVVFAAQGANERRSFWPGIRLGYGNAVAGAALVAELHHVTLRHAQSALSGNPARNSSNQALAGRVTLNDLLIEEGSRGIYGCFPELVGHTIRGMGHAAVEEAYGPAAASSVRYADLTIEGDGGYYGIHLTGCSTGETVVEHNTFRGTGSSASRPWSSGALDLASLSAGAQRVVRVRDNLFENVSVGLRAHEARALEAVGNVFTNNGTGLSFYPSSEAIPAGRTWAVFDNLFERNGLAIDMGAYRGERLGVHGNRFVENTAVVGGLRAGAVFALQGNYLGAEGARAYPGHHLLTGEPGTRPPAPGIPLTVDASNALGAPWAFGEAPAAIILEPRSHSRYRSTCVPLQALAPTALVDVADIGTDENSDPDSVRWYLLPGGDESSRQLVTPDADGCLAGAALSEGAYHLLLEADVREEGELVRTTQHRTRFLVDDEVVSGTVWRAAETWSGDLLVDGDVLVPAGHKLTLAPGTRLRIAARDGRYHAMPISVSYVAGSTAKVDFQVQGELVALGSAGAPITLETEGVTLPGAWNGIQVWADARAALRHVVASGAADLLVGHGADAEGALSHVARAPEIFLSDAELEVSSSVAYGACPLEFARVTVTSIGALLKEGQCFDDLVLEEVDAEVRGGAIQAHATYFTGLPAAPTLHLLNTRLTCTQNCSSGYGLNVSAMALTIESSELIEFDRMVVRAGAQPILVSDSLFAGFDQYAFTGSNPVAPRIEVRGSRFFEGARVTYGHYFAASLVFENNRVEDVGEAFSGHHLGASVGYHLTLLRARGNEFVRVGRLFTTYLAEEFFDVQITGNNFREITTSVVDVGSESRPRSVMDLSGNHWGVASEAEIRALIADGRTDIAAEHKGEVKYSGWSATPLSLPDVPPSLP